MQTWIYISELVRNFRLALAAFGGFYLAWRKLTPELKQAGTAADKIALDRRAHVVELFNRAAGQLSDERLEIRLCAIYILREIGRDFPDLANPVFELLTAYLREKRQVYESDDTPVDIREIYKTLLEWLTDNENAA